MHALRRIIAARPAFQASSARMMAPLAARTASYSAPVSRRWYSDAKAEEPKPAEQPAEKPTASESAEKEPTELDLLKKEVEKKDKEIVDLKDKYLRSVADFRNLQERIKRETASARDFAIQKFAKDLVESVDNLERALDAVTEDKLLPKDKIEAMPGPDAQAAYQTAHTDLLSLHEGVRMIETIFLNTLAKHGLVRTDPAKDAEPFDPNRHEAVFQAPQPDKPDGSVFFTQQKGFVLNGRTLRAAKVGVVKNS